LRNQGVEQAQGYYWSPPLAAADFATWVAEFSGGSTRQARALELV
jgi:EAL domain-containing protein (putative c-di-GMP-specific phosphodiesterase class I)